VHIKSMLLRLQNTLKQVNLWENLLLIPGKPSQGVDVGDRSEIHLVAGYTGSPASHNALDLVLWMAHQSRLVTQKRVTVHIVYVGEDAYDQDTSALAESFYEGKRSIQGRSAVKTLEPHPVKRAGQILEQARTLAQEWGGPLNAHFHSGNVAQVLKSVVESESAGLLVLGCSSPQHWLIRQLGADFPCPVLGIPRVAKTVLSAVPVLR
jgi:nucleotide-binding universal stress UspA family protein